MFTDLASGSSAIGKAMHALGLPDWTIYLFIALVIGFTIVRKMMKPYDG
jgi:hypothetical protein